MASTEQADLQGFTAAKYNQMILSNAAVASPGHSASYASGPYEHNWIPKIYDGGERNWTAYQNFQLIHWRPEFTTSIRNTITDKPIVRIKGINSAAIPTTARPILITFDASISVNSGTSTIGMILNSTAVNTNASPLVSTTGNTATQCFYHGEIWFHPFSASYGGRGLCMVARSRAYNGGVAKATARVLGAAATIPNAAITSITFTGTNGSNSYLSWISIGNIGIWEMRTGIG